MRHKGTRAVITFCRQQGVGSLFIGNPQGVRKQDSGHHHNQRMAQWEYGQDLAYLAYTAKLARIESFTGPDRGTSSRCPVCGWKQKVRGRVWRCRNQACSFTGHRDVVGSVNMHPLALGSTIDFPAQVTYQRPSPVTVSCRNEQLEQERCGRPDTGHQCIAGVVLASRNLSHRSDERASSEAGYRSGAAKKPIP